MRRPALRLAVVASLGAAACGVRTRPVTPVIESLDVRAARALDAVRDTAHAAAARGAHARADSALDAFGAQFFGTPAAAEALYARALLRADPANAGVTPREVAAALEAYEREGGALPRGYDVVVLRRLLAQRDSLRAVLTTQRGAAALLVPRDSLRARDQAEQALRLELERLRVVLEQTQAELARVRRRLAPPRRR